MCAGLYGHPVLLKENLRKQCTVTLFTLHMLAESDAACQVLYYALFRSRLIDAKFTKNSKFCLHYTQVAKCVYITNATQLLKG